MEIFETKDAAHSKIFLEVNFDYKYLSRTWVEKEETGSWKKTTINDSNPGDGNIPFFEIGSTAAFKDRYRIIILTYFDLQKVKDTAAFIEKLKISYHVVEDDDEPGSFHASKIYQCNPDEIVVSDDKIILLVTKIIAIQ
jgi:hypothetical protein